MHAAEAFAPAYTSPRRAGESELWQAPQAPQAPHRINHRGSVAGHMGLPGMPLEGHIAEDSRRVLQGQAKSLCHDGVHASAVGTASSEEDVVVHDQQSEALTFTTPHPTAGVLSECFGCAFCPRRFRVPAPEVALYNLCPKRWR